MTLVRACFVGVGVGIGLVAGTTVLLYLLSLIRQGAARRDLDARARETWLRRAGVDPQTSRGLRFARCRTGARSSS